ncbi:MAG: AlpA family phage regulatory protein [Terracidiphilus sp.]|nr:AlpA family phage regulatory protein [Terracidiphilus sp.]
MEGRPQRFLRLDDVRVRIPYSRSTIYQLVAQGKFPKPINLGDRAVAWIEADIDKWMADRIASVGRA